MHRGECCPTPRPQIWQEALLLWLLLRLLHRQNPASKTNTRHRITSPMMQCTRSRLPVSFGDCHFYGTGPISKNTFLPTTAITPDTFTETQTPNPLLKFASPLSPSP